MTSDERRLALASWLLQAGAGHSARNVLGTLRGARANRIRLASQETILKPGIYCLVALPDATGAVVPLRAIPGHPRSNDRAFRDACVEAHAQACRTLQDRSLPMLRFELEEELALFGSSVGLPALLAFVAHFSPSQAPATAVLATGALLADGRIDRVGHLDTKYAIARRERGASVVIFPPGRVKRPGVLQVDTVGEAVKLVFGDRPLCLDPSLSAVEAMLRRARTASDAAEGASLLASLNLETLAVADRARVLFDLGTLRRNCGESGAAWELHEQAGRLLGSVRNTIGSELAERYELECFVTALDRFHLRETIARIRDRLGRPFLKLRNELRCRGMLAQGLAMSGRFKEAIAVRTENLGIHEQSEALGKVLPATLCHLTLDAALAREEALFERSARALQAATKAGDEAQWRYNGAVVVRGLALLGRSEEAIAWIQSETSLFEARPPATLVFAASGEAPSIGPPEISALRALIRALRRCGRNEEAIALATHVLAAARDLSDLFGWIAELVRLELALAIHDDGARDRGDEALRTARTRLLCFHRDATEFHSGLLHASGSALEGELDRVWY